MRMTKQPTNNAALLLAVSGLALFANGIGSAKETSAANQPAKAVSLQIHVQTPGESEAGQPLRLRGADRRQQILVTAKFSSGALRDYTRQVSFQTAPAGVVKVDKYG